MRRALLVVPVLAFCAESPGGAQTRTENLWSSSDVVKGQCAVGVRRGATTLHMGYLPGGDFGFVIQRAGAFGARQGSRVPVELRWIEANGAYGGGHYRTHNAEVGRNYIGVSAPPDVADSVSIAARQASAFELVISGRSHGRVSLAGSSQALLSLETCRPAASRVTRRGSGGPGAGGYGTRLSDPAMGRAIPRVMVAQIDQAIASSSRTWILNRYDRGSIKNVFRMSGYEQPGAFRLIAQYSYNGGLPGFVEVQYRGGRIECMYFFDNPTFCRRP